MKGLVSTCETDAVLQVAQNEPLAANPAGDVLLDGLRVNQLKLSRNLSGSLQVSDKEVHMHAKVGLSPSPNHTREKAWTCFARGNPIKLPLQHNTQFMIQC